MATAPITGNPANNNPGPAFVSGSLASVVQSGADEPLTFSFVISEGSLRSYLENLGLTSQGEANCSYDLNGSTLYAFVNKDRPGEIVTMPATTVSSSRSS